MLFARIDVKIEALSENPRPSGCKKLRGYKDHWRVRIGAYRLIYILDDAARTVTITHVAHRREVY